MGHTTREETRDMDAESFTEIPPNAALVIHKGDVLTDVVLTLNKETRIDGEDLIFENVKLIEGEMHSIGGGCSVFIDTIRRRRPPGPRGSGKPGPKGLGKPGPHGPDPRGPR